MENTYKILNALKKDFPNLKAGLGNQNGHSVTSSRVFKGECFNKDLTFSLPGVEHACSVLKRGGISWYGSMDDTVYVYDKKDPKNESFVPNLRFIKGFEDTGINETMITRSITL